ncbi:hypothetical protein C8F01DRAFT_1212348 [Mycena amicta]|nr:hypothetical protein C8F01DRAFT_1212348 [Mycena amicta]
MRSLTLILCAQFIQTFAQTWCNKNYLPGQPVVPPGGRFEYNSGVSPDPLLVLRCSPIITPYIAEEDYEAGIFVEAFVTHSLRYPESERVHASLLGLQVSISVDGTTLSTAFIAVNSTIELQFPLTNLSHAARKEPFDVDCTASGSGALLVDPKTFKTTTRLSYLPRPVAGSVTKRDGRTGALLVRDASSSSYEPIFPFGFYTSFDGYLDSDLSILDSLKADGFTIVHPVPTFGDLEALERVLDRMEQLELYLVYDMRHTYRDPAALEAEVNLIKHRSNLLLWYTADEPDGTSEPLDVTRRAYDRIYSLAFGYHPVSIVLNCADYEFASYAEGADIVMPDTYTIANNPVWSNKYNTSCTEDFGCCGCDNCKGELEDVSRRLDDFALRLDVLGWMRRRAVWAVPQAFGADEFWTRRPSGREFAAQVILSVNHGARGIMPWIDPTTEDIKTTAALLAKTLNASAVKRILFSPRVNFERIISNRVDIGKWTITGAVLLMVTNLNAHTAVVTVPWSNGLELEEMLNEGVTSRNVRDELELALEGLGYAVFLSRSSALMLQNPPY